MLWRLTGLLAQAQKQNYHILLPKLGLLRASMFITVPSTDCVAHFDTILKILTSRNFSVARSPAQIKLPPFVFPLDTTTLFSVSIIPI